MKKVKNWVGNLQSVLDKSNGKPFDWGSFNCCMFAADCVEAQTGIDFLDGEREKVSDKKSVIKYLEREAEGSLIQFMENITAKYNMKEIKPALAQRGDLAIVKDHTGRAAFAVIDLSGQSVTAIKPGIGASRVSLSAVERAWRVG